MWTYYPELLARPVPRYTSYPTAADFHDGIGVGDYHAALDTIGPDTEISLYVHIPFCEQICWYCGCNTGKSNRAERLSAYMKALHAEIAMVSRRLAGRGKITRIAFGGGSPNAISPVQFARLYDAIELAFKPNGHAISIELDPRSFFADWIRVLQTIGVSHASLGVQTFDDDIQARIGRIQSSDLIRKTTDALCEAGVSSLNFDLMYGLPGQDIGVLEATLEQAANLTPDRIALFGYAHVPDLISRQKRIDGSILPDAKERFDMAAFGHRYLTMSGYLPIGFDHFAQPGDPLSSAAENGKLHRNFQGFTEDSSETLIGLGASAISQFPTLLAQNEKASGKYRAILGYGELPISRGVAIDDLMRSHGKVIGDILCRGKASLVGLDGRREIAQQLEPFVERGLVDREGDHIILTKSALPYARTVASVFDDFRKYSRGRFSAAV